MSFLPHILLAVADVQPTLRAGGDAAPLEVKEGVIFSWLFLCNRLYRCYSRSHEVILLEYQLVAIVDRKY